MAEINPRFPWEIPRISGCSCLQVELILTIWGRGTETGEREGTLNFIINVPHLPCSFCAWWVVVVPGWLVRWFLESSAFEVFN